MLIFEWVVTDIMDKCTCGALVGMTESGGYFHICCKCCGLIASTLVNEPVGKYHSPTRARHAVNCLTAWNQMIRRAKGEIK